MKFHAALGSAVFALLPATALAAPPALTCPGLAALKENANSCRDNITFGQAGLDCYNALQRAIQARAAAAKSQLAASNALKIDKAGNQQNHNFQGANADYGISQDALTELIASAKLAHGSVDGYLNNIIFPEDFDAGEEIIGDMIEFIDSEPCYNENRLGLEDLKKRIEKNIRELEAAKAASLARANVSGHRDTNTGSLTAPVAHGTAGIGAAAHVPSGPSRNPASSITGVREDEAKRAQGEQKLR